MYNAVKRRFGRYVLIDVGNSSGKQRLNISMYSLTLQLPAATLLQILNFSLSPDREQISTFASRTCPCVGVLEGFS